MQGRLFVANRKRFVEIVECQNSKFLHERRALKA